MLDYKSFIESADFFSYIRSTYPGELFKNFNHYAKKERDPQYAITSMKTFLSQRSFKTIETFWVIDKASQPSSKSELRVRLVPGDAKLMPPAGPLLAQGLGPVAAEFMDILNKSTQGLVDKKVSFTYPKDLLVGVKVHRVLANIHAVYVAFPDFAKLFECFNLDELIKQWFDYYVKITADGCSTDDKINCFLKMTQIEKTIYDMFVIYLSFCGIFTLNFLLKDSATKFKCDLRQGCFRNSFLLFKKSPRAYSKSRFENNWPGCFFYVEVLRCAKNFFGYLGPLLVKNAARVEKPGFDNCNRALRTIKVRGFKDLKEFLGIYLYLEENDKK